MLKAAPTEKLAAIETELLALVDKPTRSREELMRIPVLETKVETLKAEIRAAKARAKMADPAYRAKLAAMPPIKPAEGWTPGDGLE